MKINKKVNNQDHIIEFSDTKKIEILFTKQITNIDIFIIDKNLLQNNRIKKIYEKFKNRCFLITGYEKIKTLSNFNTLIEKILKIGIQRKSKLISVGGGTIGDLSGFIASSLLRGIDHIMVPTSLLAMVDSAIGGKTGVNSKHGKNLVGTFYLPKKVFICPDFLKSLPKRELNCGFAEIIKYSYIFPGGLKNKLLNFKNINSSNIVDIIKLSVSTKLRYVSDFREKSNNRRSRAILNFGHSIGHAIENSNSYNTTIKHGEAIALGMLIELKLSKYLKFYKGNIRDQIDLMKKFGLPTNYNRYLTSGNINKLVMKMMFDKKTTGQYINFIFIDNLGGFVKKISFQKIKVLLNKIH